jgi:glycosyltransferase involved in cell wall biosynthesis
MKIGIDISSLQGAHRMRGIGYTTANFLENLPQADGNEYVLFFEDEGEIDSDTVLSSLSLDIPYSVRHFVSAKSKKHLPWKFRYLSKLISKLSNVALHRSGDKRFDISGLDVFIQFDQNKPLPVRTGNTSLFFIAYDLIPYVLEKDYLISYKTARQRGLKKRAAIKSALNRYSYLQKIRLNCKRADKIIAISETTKRDFVQYCTVAESKISVATLGISDLSSGSTLSNGDVNRYKKTSWGYIANPTSLKNKPFLLFVGGADERRRLHDLVAAFNHLKAQGSNLKLVLSGDIMKGPLDIPTHNIQKALLSSSYLDDIYFVGFTDNTTRNWLYEHATAFVFPSVYEGFGLPVLEAMSLGTPVVCYRNRAVEEVASTIPFYANDILSLIDAITEVQSHAKKSGSKLESVIARGIEHTKKYTWEKTATKIIDLLS